MASEEDEELVWITDCGPFIVIIDPLDDSRNIDASIPTGTIFRIYNRLADLDQLSVQEKAQLNSLQRGTRLIVAGYVLFSSAIIMCFSFGSGTHAFTLDRSTREFVLMHPSIQIPPQDNQEPLILNPLTGIPSSIFYLIVDVWHLFSMNLQSFSSTSASAVPSSFKPVSFASSSKIIIEWLFTCQVKLFSC